MASQQHMKQHRVGGAEQEHSFLKAQTLNTIKQFATCKGDCYVPGFVLPLEFCTQSTSPLDKTVHHNMSMHSQREAVTCLALSSELNSAHNLEVPWIRQCTTILHMYAVKAVTYMC